MTSFDFTLYDTVQQSFDATLNKVVKDIVLSQNELVTFLQQCAEKKDSVLPSFVFPTVNSLLSTRVIEDLIEQNDYNTLGFLPEIDAHISKTLVQTLINHPFVVVRNFVFSLSDEQINSPSASYLIQQCSLKDPNLLDSFLPRLKNLNSTTSQLLLSHIFSKRPQDCVPFSQHARNQVIAQTLETFLLFKQDDNAIKNVLIPLGREKPKILKILKTFPKNHPHIFQYVEATLEKERLEQHIHKVKPSRTSGKRKI